MPYIAANPESFEGKVVGNGQCVEFVRAAANVPSTSTWHQGTKVLGANQDIPRGTVIATMVGGHYPNNATGNHAAIFISQGPDGIRVWDQWQGHKVAMRTIRSHGHSPSNDADAFYVVE